MKIPFTQPTVFEFTGNCPVRIRTADGHSVGRCWHSTYQGVCPSHGQVGDFIALAEGELCSLDENDLLPRKERDFGSKELQQHLGVTFASVDRAWRLAHKLPTAKERR